MPRNALQSVQIPPSSGITQPPKTAPSAHTVAKNGPTVPKQRDPLSQKLKEALQRRGKWHPAPFMGRRKQEALKAKEGEL